MEAGSEEDWQYYIQVENAKLIGLNTCLGTISLTMLYRVKGMTNLSKEDLENQTAAIEERNKVLTEKIIKMKNLVEEASLKDVATFSC